MQVILETIVKGKVAQLVLDGDNVNIIYDGVIIDTNNAKSIHDIGNNGIEYAYLYVIVECYIDNLESKRRFDMEASKLGW